MPVLQRKHSPKPVCSRTQPRDDASRRHARLGRFASLHVSIRPTRSYARQSVVFEGNWPRSGDRSYRVHGLGECLPLHSITSCAVRVSAQRTRSVRVVRSRAKRGNEVVLDGLGECLPCRGRGRTRIIRINNVRPGVKMALKAASVVVALDDRRRPSPGCRPPPVAKGIRNL